MSAGGRALNPQIRKPVIAGNWKMYKTIAETQAFFDQLAPLIFDTNHCEIIIAAPFTALQRAVEFAGPMKVRVSGQDVYWEKEGAYTGEVSVPMLKDAGCSHTLIGHSERRQFFGETNETVNRKLKAALAGALIPIVCVGETLSERDAAQTNAV